MDSVLFFPCIAIFILLLISGFFSGSETGLTAASRAKIHKLKIEGSKRAKQVSILREDKERLIGAILLGNNLVNIAASTIATAVAIRLVGEGGVFYVTIIMTLLVLIFAEVMPKTYAIQNSEKVALGVAPIFMVLVKILAPITHTVQVIVNITMRFLRLVPKEGEHKEVVSAIDAIRGAIELHHHEGAVVKSYRDMLGGVLDLNEITVADVMIHRKQMWSLDIETSPEDLIHTALDGHHSRIPLWQDNHDNIVKILYVKNLVKTLKSYKGDIADLNIADIAVDPLFIPETTLLSDQLNAFRENRYRIAMVVDEYGDLQGLVTLEDILEEIVGLINDEHEADTTLQGAVEEQEGVYRFPGNMPIRDINRELGWELPDDDATTVAGLVIFEAETIPEVGQSFEFHDYAFDVLEKEGNQLTVLRVSKIDDPEVGNNH